MAGSCCRKPIAKIIKVGDSESGIIGLEEIFKKISASGISEEEEIKSMLLELAQKYGNYIAPGLETDYKDALLREYGKFIENKI